jgi:hypothetical protein
MPARQCTATSTRTGERCRRAPIKGGLVCTTHGGSTRQAKAGAAKRLALQAAEADAAAVLAHEGQASVERPVEELAELASSVKATTAALGRRVNALAEVRFEDAKGAEQTRAEMVLWGQWIDRLTRLLEALAKAGFEERRVRVEEEQATLVARVLAAALAEVGLADRSDEVLRVVARRLDAVA